MSVNIVVPEMGESIVDARIARWLKKEGDAVAVGEPLVELETDKVDVEVNAPQNGVLKQMFYSRFWAKKQGKVATGAPTTFKMQGGTSTMEQMIASTERGLLVTRLWYLRPVDPRTALFTGLTLNTLGATVVVSTTVRNDP